MDPGLSMVTNRRMELSGSTKNPEDSLWTSEASCVSDRLVGKRTIVAATAAVPPSVSRSWMQNTLRSHFSHARHHLTGIQYKEDTRTFISQEFANYGLHVLLQTFPTPIENVTGQNIIGILKGKNFGRLADTIWGIAAHYDTMPNTRGVDDNGSGMVAMLQAAQILSAKGQPENTILFLAFDLEEWERGVTACVHGVCGSKAFVDQWLPWYFNMTYGVADDQSLKRLLGGVIVLDTVMNFNNSDFSQTVPAGMQQAFPNSYAKIVANNNRGNFLFEVDRPDDQQLASVFSTAWKRPSTIEFPLNSIQLPITGALTRLPAYVIRRVSTFLRSDHKSFWDRGYAAIFLTDTGDFRGSMSDCYHAVCDNMAAVTDDKLKFLEKVTQALIDTIGPLSSLSGHRPTTQISATDGLPIG
ncbi:hypothetical protein ScPMuIL_005375 [Solemya velum]